MKVERTGSASFTAQFDSEDELRVEHNVNLAFGALKLPTTESIATETTLSVTLRGPFGAELPVKANVVTVLPDGLALMIDADPATILDRLLHREDEKENEKAETQNQWDRVRGQSQMEKILLAIKADRTDRAVLLQDNDPRVLLSLLRNPRLTIDEVVRMTKSSFLNYQIADVIMASAQWMANLDVRLGLIRNPKTPQAMSLRILPTLPDAEVRAIARAGTNMALKQAAIRRLQGRT